MVRVHVDDALKAKATDTLSEVGLTLSDAVRILLTRVVAEGGLPPGLTTDPKTYDDDFAIRFNKPSMVRAPTCRTLTQCAPLNPSSTQSNVPKIEWTSFAVKDLLSIVSYIAEERPEAKVAKLEDHPQM